jgi:hypothetical protein
MLACCSKVTISLALTSDLQRNVAVAPSIAASLLSGNQTESVFK